MKKLLLLSSSRVHGHEFLGHVQERISSFLDGADRLVFFPFAAADHDAYVNKVQHALRDVCEVTGAHELNNEEVSRAEAVFIGGGNTFRLLARMYERGLVELVKAMVESGIPYLGASAGTNVACPTIRTTNDMPIVQPPSLDALGFVPFQINAHFVERGLGPQHKGETREQRIAEFHEENVAPVIGLREPARLVLQDSKLVLEGDGGAMLFAQGRTPVALSTGADVTYLLDMQ